MRRPDPFVLESLETRAISQDLAALDAYNKGNHANRDIFTKAADDTRKEIEQYKQRRSVGGVQ
jgi:hypothetical protein